MPKYEKRLVIIACHGVGDWDYRDEGLAWFEKMYKRIWGYVEKAGIPENFMDVHTVRWGPKVQKLQDEFRDRNEKHLRDKFGLWNWLMNRINNSIRNGMISSAGDILAIFPGMQRDIIHAEVENALDQATKMAKKARASAGLPANSRTMVMIIGHSLGAVILADYFNRAKIFVNGVWGGLVLNSAAFYGSPLSFFYFMSSGMFVPQFNGCEIIRPQFLNVWTQLDPASSVGEEFIGREYDPDRVEFVDKHVIIPGKLGRIPVIPHTRYAFGRDTGFQIARRIIHIHKALS